MKHLLCIAAALALTIVAIGLGARLARAAEVPEACSSVRDGIPALALERTDHPERCGFGSRPVVDGPAGAVLPPPGEGVYVEVLTARGAHELALSHLRDGGVEVGYAGEETEDVAALGAWTARSSASGECANPSYRSSGWRVVGKLPYRVNVGTVPRELSPTSAVAAIRRAGRNVADTRNRCRLGDRVPAGLSYKGKTSRFPDRRDGSCARGDGLSVVAFGALPSALAVTCTYYELASGEVISSDIKIDKSRFRWTTSPGGRGCEGRYDLQSVVTHERGHTFGLGHVPEAGNPNMTMSPVINGTCQLSERTLGRGDVLGLDGKYP